MEKKISKKIKELVTGKLSVLNLFSSVLGGISSSGDEGNQDNREKQVRQQILTVSNELGLFYFPATDFYYFKTENRQYWAYHATGRYRLNQTLSTLITQLDPATFYRIRSNIVVNLMYVEGYKFSTDHYVIRLSKPEGTTVDMPKYRIQELKTRLATCHLRTHGVNPL